MTISDYAENKILDAIFTNASFAVAAVYVKLHTADPGEAGTTAAAGNTVRQTSAFATAASGATSNTAALTWTSVSTTEVYSHISLWDNVSAGNCLWTGPLTATKSVNSGDTFVIAIGDLDVTLD
jgi:hypothetical protein